MTIVSRAECGQEQWDGVVSSSPDGWVWALWNWQELILSVPPWQLSDASFGITEHDRLVAAVPLQWSSDRTRLSGSGFGLTAPAVAGDVTADDRERYRARIFDHVSALAGSGHASRVEFALSPVSRSSLSDPRGANPFVKFGFADESSHARVLDLSPDEDDLLAQCSKDTRQQIKRARAAGVTVRRADWLESLDDYYALHTETYQRTGETPHPREYFAGIATRLGRSQHSVLWGAYDAFGRPIAFHNSARLGSGAMYHTGCSSRVALENGANYLVFWEAIVGARTDGARWYEIGEVFPGAQGKKGGLTTFKSKFGGDTHRVFRAGMMLAAPPVEEAAPAAMRAVGQAVRQSLRATRRISERLIGPAITNSAARAVVAGARSLRQMGGRRADAPAPRALRFFRPYWDEAEARAVEEFAAAPRLDRESRLAARLREIEGLDPSASVSFFSSGRGALLAALKVFAAHQPSRQYVIIPSYSCKGLFDAVVNAGLKPRFVDVDADFNADRDALLAALDEEVLAFVPVHLAGRRFAHDHVIGVARQRGIYVIEDKAHAFGSGWRLESDAVIYSFGLGKNVMSTAGGAVVGLRHQDEFAQLRVAMVEEDPGVARARYEYCRTAYFSDTPGAGGYPSELRPDYRIAAMNAVDLAILERQFDKTAAIVNGNRAHAAPIVAALAAQPSLFHIQSSGPHAYTKLMVDLGTGARRDRFLGFMSVRGIELEWMYVPLHHRDFGRLFATAPLPNTERLDGTVVNVPVRPNLMADDVQRIAAAIREFAAEASRG